MPPVLQKWPLRVPLGGPKAALRSPKGPQRAAQSPPRAPPGALGGALALPKAPPRPPRSTFDRPRGISKNKSFIVVKTYISAQRRATVNRCNAFGMLLWPLLFLFCFLSFCFSLFVGAAVSIHLVVARLGCQLASPRVPQGRLWEEQCTILFDKINEFEMPPFFPKLLLRGPSPTKVPKLPRGSPRSQ